MLMLILQLLLATFTGVIVHKVVMLVSSMSKESWRDEKGRFLLLVIGHSLIAGGALAVLFSIWWGGIALVLGVGLKFSFDRRLLDVHRSMLVNRVRS